MASNRGAYVSKLEEQLTCSVCLGLYTNPRILPCHHSFCLKCLEGVPLCPKPENNYYLHCPVCRCIAEISGTVGVTGLPLAFELKNFREIYDKMKSSECNSQSKSSQAAATGDSATNVACHHSDKKQVFCETCNALICINCTSESHKSHNWNSLDESYRRFVFIPLCLFLKSDALILLQEFIREVSI